MTSALAACGRGQSRSRKPPSFAGGSVGHPSQKTPSLALQVSPQNHKLGLESVIATSLPAPITSQNRTDQNRQETPVPVHLHLPWLQWGSVTSRGQVKRSCMDTWMTNSFGCSEHAQSRVEWKFGLTKQSRGLTRQSFFLKKKKKKRDDESAGELETAARHDMGRCDVRVLLR